MTQEEKSLLLIDLCARLPYGIVVNIPHVYHNDFKAYIKAINPEREIIYYEICGSSSPLFDRNILGIKPYLRPMSSITEEEAKELSILYGFKDILSIKITDEYIDVIVDDGVCSTEIRTIWYGEIISSIEIFDWLNAHHFDYRGLIEKGLAIEAPEGMYN